MEISYYKRMAPYTFELVDISAPGFDAQAFRLSPEAVEREMHVLTPEGELKVGVDAFVQIWSVLKKYRWLSHVIQMPGIYFLARLGYKLFARMRRYLPKKHRPL